jgi:hypothetical protein
MRILDGLIEEAVFSLSYAHSRWAHYRQGFLVGLCNLNLDTLSVWI